MTLGSAVSAQNPISRQKWSGETLIGALAVLTVTELVRIPNPSRGQSRETPSFCEADGSVGSPRGLHANDGAADATSFLWSRVPSPFSRGSVTGPVPGSRAPRCVSNEPEACGKAPQGFPACRQSPGCPMQSSEAALQEAHAWVHSDSILLGGERVFSILLCAGWLF